MVRLGVKRLKYIHLIFLFHSNLRELAFQISEQFEALGSLIGVKCGKTSFV